MSKKVTWPAKKSAACAITIDLDGEFRWEQQYNQLKKEEIIPLRILAKNSMEKGVPRLLDLLAAYEVKATFFVSYAVVTKYPQLIRRISAQGHEIASFGHANENLALVPYKEQETLIRQSKEALESVIGKQIQGFRAPEGELTKETLTIAKHENFTYSSNLFSDNHPFLYPLSKEENLVELPSSWSLCDLPYFIANLTPSEPVGQCRIPNYEAILNNWKWDCEGYMRLNGCCVFQFNPQTIATLGRIYLFEELLKFLRKKETLWLATCEEISDFAQAAWITKKEGE